MLVHGPVVGFPLAPGNQPEQPVAPDHLVGVADEGLQQLKLGGGQVDCFAARRKQRPLGQIEAPASKAHHRRHGGGPFRAELGAPQHAAHAGEQLARMKRLGDIVIRADLETDSAVDRVSLPVRITTAMSDRSRRNRVRLRPLSPGMVMSTSARSIRSRSMMSRNRAALSAVVTRNPSFAR